MQDYHLHVALDTTGMHPSREQTAFGRTPACVHAVQHTTPQHMSSPPPPLSSTPPWYQGLVSCLNECGEDAMATATDSAAAAMTATRCERITVPTPPAAAPAAAPNNSTRTAQTTTSHSSLPCIDVADELARVYGNSVSWSAIQFLARQLLYWVASPRATQ